jgi:hypothetical protein
MATGRYLKWWFGRYQVAEDALERRIASFVAETKAPYSVKWVSPSLTYLAFSARAAPMIV